MPATRAATRPTDPETTHPPAEAEQFPEVGLFALPRARRSAAAAADRVRRALAPDGFAPLRVLVVDDNPDAADPLAAVLDLLGCPVRACYSGAEALAVAAEFGPQVCLLDLMMPVMDGLELASRLKERAAGRTLFLVATTGLADEEMRARTALAGFHYHLTKPVDVPTLIGALGRLGEILARPGDPDTLAEPTGVAWAAGPPRGETCTP